MPPTPFPTPLDGFRARMTEAADAGAVSDEVAVRLVRADDPETWHDNEGRQ